jgi:hypothetical protein
MPLVETITNAVYKRQQLQSLVKLDADGASKQNDDDFCLNRWN